MNSKLEILATNVDVNLKKDTKKDKKRKFEKTMQEIFDTFTNVITEQLRQNNLFLFREFCKKIDEFNSKIDEFNNKIDAFNSKIDKCNNKLENFERKFDRFEQNYNEDRLTNRQFYSNITYSFNELNARFILFEERVLKALEKYDKNFDLAFYEKSESSRDSRK